ncbi:MAG: uroporphyrinogen-III synthase [Sphingobacteriales bacterium]|jgi:uroporphyrinogen-III synthase|nr:uroporphyrinogen-III synthase [Sphingobacteriales bacterium]
MDKKLKVKSILVTQPKPESDKSPFFDLAKKFNLKIDFRPFIHVEGIPGKEFRKEKISPLDFSAVIFTSRNSIDHYFRVCEELRIEASSEMKYFCITEAVALYMQKYVQYRKRKVFIGKQTTAELLEVIKKHKEENFFYPCTDVHTDEIPVFLRKSGFNISEAVLYRTVCSDLSDLAEVNYDMIAFFSPSGIKSLFKNFPDFKQNNTRIATFGPTTAKAVIDAGLVINIQAPSPQAPSMTMAIEEYVKTANK